LSVGCLQVGYDGDPEAALVSFASHAQAGAAYRCSEPLFNNRFIKIFWHNPDRNNTAGAGGQQQVTAVYCYMLCIGRFIRVLSCAY